MSIKGNLVLFVYTQEAIFTEPNKSLSSILNNSQQYFYATDTKMFLLTSLNLTQC